MFKTILFDLDGTLLNIDMDYFLQKYFSLMVNMAGREGCSGYKKLVDHIYQATEKMILSQDAGKTNEQIFYQNFFNSKVYKQKEYIPFFDKFYREGFPALSCHCQSFPGIPQMMEKLNGNNIKIVIATNPVFPRSAIEDRLKWAGVDHHNYALITSYENMHFCKPNPSYYLEICDRLGVKPDECLMVGNDTGEDLAASLIGIKTFLVEDMLIDKGADFVPDWRGSLKDLYMFLENIYHK